MDKRSRYFQTIASCFLKQRGAPLFLSSKDLDLIAKWEKMKIPLRIVCEGINQYFEINGSKVRKRSKIISLVLCNSHVLKAFDQYRERKVGQKIVSQVRDDRKKRIKLEVNKFLVNLPGPCEYLRSAYCQVQSKLASRNITEEELEIIEENIEELMTKNMPEEEKEIIKKEVLIEYMYHDKNELERVFRIKLIKYIRDKYKIPYVSPFYY